MQLNLFNQPQQRTVRVVVCWSHKVSVMQGRRAPRVDLVEHPIPHPVYGPGPVCREPYRGELEGRVTQNSRGWEYAPPQHARIGQCGSWPAPPLLVAQAETWEQAKENIGALLHPNDQDRVDPVPRYAEWLCPLFMYEPGLPRHRAARSIDGRRPLWCNWAQAPSGIHPDPLCEEKPYTGPRYAKKEPLYPPRWGWFTGRQ